MGKVPLRAVVEEVVGNRLGGRAVRKDGKFAVDVAVIGKWRVELGWIHCALKHPGIVGVLL